jgi:tetratricopeptide (TPR) repeat protein
MFVLSQNEYSQKENFNDLLNSGKTFTYKALVLHDKDMLLEALNQYGKILKADTSNLEALYGLIFVEYRFLELSLQKGNDSLFNQYYQSSLVNAAKLISANKYLSEGKSLLAGIYMMKIASSPMSAVTLSSKINRLLNDAEEANPKNPTTFIVRGEMKYNTPKLFGGSIEDAVNNFNKAVLICEQNPDSTLVDTEWAYLESLAWLGQAYARIDNYDAAKFAYQKALSIQADFSWVKYILLPKIEKKEQN